MKRHEREGYWCDICHQLHYQISPNCERRRRERKDRGTYTPSPEVIAEIETLIRRWREGEDQREGEKAE